MNQVDSLLLIFITVLTAGFFAGSETAVVSCSKVRVHDLAKRGSWKGRHLEKLLRSTEKFFSIVLVGTNLSVIVCTVTATALFVTRFGQAGAFISTIVMAPLLLIFGEVIPKSTYLYHADSTALLVAPVLRLMYYCFWPIAYPATFLARLLTGSSRDSTGMSRILSTREELIYLYNRGRKGGSVEEREVELIDRVFKFSKITVGDLMVKMDRVASLLVTASVDEAIDLAGKHTFSRFPLVSPENGNIVGIVSVFDLLGLDGGERLARVMHKPVFVRSGQYAEKLLIRMKEDPHHFAVVTDENGNSTGIVTLEDILENFIGEIETGYR